MSVDPFQTSLALLLSHPSSQHPSEEDASLSDVRPFLRPFLLDLPSVTPSRKKSRTPRSRSSTAELDVKPAVPETAEENVEEPGDCIVAVNPDSLVVSYDLKPAPRRDAAGKAGFISSASRWMSRLPALGTLFSPSRHGFDITGEHEDVNEQDHDPSTKESSRRRKSTPQLLRTQSQSELGASSSHKRKTLVTRDDSSSLGSRSSRSSKRLKVGITQSEPIVVVESDGEDELLLSPETARQRRAEEQKAMRESDLTQHSTGRFDGESLLCSVHSASVLTIRCT
jgi:hypothetical protein